MDIVYTSCPCNTDLSLQCLLQTELQISTKREVHMGFLSKLTAQFFCLSIMQATDQPLTSVIRIQLYRQVWRWYGDWL